MTKDTSAAVIDRPSSTRQSKGSKAARYINGSSPESQEELLQRYLPIVKSTVGRMKINLPSHVEEDDLHSVGLTGLISALKRYDPAQKDSFGAYAAMRVRGAILDELRRMDWMPRNARTNSKRLRTTVEDLEQRLGRPATEDEIRRELNLSAEEYSDLLDAVRPITFVPLDHTPLGEDDENGNLYEVITDHTETSTTDRLEREEMIRLLGLRINQLPEVQRKVLAMYYYEDMRLAEIAAVFGLTESRICQIHSQAVLSLRAYLTSIMNR